jgi:hypothetical protein
MKKPVWTWEVRRSKETTQLELNDGNPPVNDKVQYAEHNTVAGASGLHLQYVGQGLLSLLWKTHARRDVGMLPSLLPPPPP